MYKLEYSITFIDVKKKICKELKFKDVIIILISFYVDKFFGNFVLNIVKIDQARLVKLNLSNVFITKN